MFVVIMYIECIYYVPALFYEDEGVFVCEIVRIEAENMIGVVVGGTGRCGLNIYMGRSNGLLHNHRGMPPCMVGE